MRAALIAAMLIAARQPLAIAAEPAYVDVPVQQPAMTFADAMIFPTPQDCALPRIGLTQEQQRPALCVQTRFVLVGERRAAKDRGRPLPMSRSFLHAESGSHMVGGAA
jgi:hypothetical protein